MKKILAAAILLAAAFLAVRAYQRFAAVRCYERFADAWARERPEEALRYTEGETARLAVEKKGLRSLIDARTMEALHGIRYSEERVEGRDGGDLAVEATQTVAFDPPGVTSAIGGAMWMTFHHSARLRKTDEGWKVVDFEPTYLDSARTRRR